ncbi:MAG: zf-HC2 domain-containing protein [Burkholderiales bacterium]|nr:zf-HC2 domain-containing protein [Burkholderiales bacterium]
MKLMRRTCKQVTALLVAREDRSLPIVERIALRFHLAACRACPVFERQLLTMRNGLRAWRNYSTRDNA